MTSLPLNSDNCKLPAPIAVLGLGISGKALVNLLLQSGIEFAAWDENEKTRESLQEQGVPLVNFAETGFKKFKTLVPAAGIKPYNPIIKSAVSQGLVIANDTDVLYDASRPVPVIGITGTNGKSTTTALTGHILKSCGVETAVGGNIGIAATALPRIESENGAYVIELSSYQIANIHHAAFDISVLLNITPDHIDWHGSIENYIAAKEKIFSLIPDGKKQTAIIGIDTPETYEIYKKLKNRSDITCIPISTEVDISGGIYIHNSIMVDATGGTPEIICPCSDFKILRGAHNHQNIMAAYAVALACGLMRKEIIAAVHTFPGLAHRQEMISRKHGITFINDSKATNFDATEKALKSYDNIYLILGGKPKEGGINGIDAYKDRIMHAYLVGEASSEFAETLKTAGISYTECSTMEPAVITAFADARKKGGDKEAFVMLSPACASFDQYSNFEERGDHFKKLVRALEVLS